MALKVATPPNTKIYKVEILLIGLATPLETRQRKIEREKETDRQRKRETIGLALKVATPPVTKIDKVKVGNPDLKISILMYFLVNFFYQTLSKEIFVNQYCVIFFFNSDQFIH